jgi:hypothetical protein
MRRRVPGMTPFDGHGVYAWWRWSVALSASRVNSRQEMLRYRL